MRTPIKIAMVVVVLLCTLATLEFPELVNLTDDTSNDFSLTVSQVTDVEVLKEQVSAAPDKVRVRTAESWAPLEDRQRCNSYPSTDLLSLLCTHKT